MIKIYKALARKMYENGEPIMVLPSRAKTTGALATWITKPQGEQGDFDKLCNAIHFYNCSPRNGQDLVFYAKEV